MSELQRADYQIGEWHIGVVGTGSLWAWVVVQSDGRLVDGEATTQLGALTAALELADKVTRSELEAGGGNDARI